MPKLSHIAIDTQQMHAWHGSSGFEERERDKVRVRHRVRVSSGLRGATGLRLGLGLG